MSNRLVPDFVVLAINNLANGNAYSLTGENLDNIVWSSGATNIPSKQQIIEEVARLEAEYENCQYQRQRAFEYPPITDYIDGIVKGDEAQVQAYIDACLAVKAKYPKPE